MDKRDVATVFWGTVIEEAKARRRSLRSVSLAVADGAPGLIDEAMRTKRSPTLPTILKVSDALGLEAHELIYRVQRRIASASA